MWHEVQLAPARLTRADGSHGKDELVGGDGCDCRGGDVGKARQGESSMLLYFYSIRYQEVEE